MKSFDPKILKELYKPSPASHKGDNGKVLIIGGSMLFHAASLWPLEIASKIVDMVFYASVPENNALVEKEKQQWRNGIVVPRNKITDYMQEADAILIGPGLPRENGVEPGDDDTKQLTENLLQKYPEKKWVIDGGSLQTIDPQFIPKHAILTPHRAEFSKLFNFQFPISNFQSNLNDQIFNEAKIVGEKAKQYNCVILLKGREDIVCSPTQCVTLSGGNAGMTKGGTGDVLAGLAVALYAQNNDPFLVACASSYFNKKAGENLFESVGYYFNASDLVAEIPQVMKKALIPHLPTSL